MTTQGELSLSVNQYCAIFAYLLHPDISSLICRSEPFFTTFSFCIITLNAFLVAADLENSWRYSLMQVVGYLEQLLGPIFWKGPVLCKLLILKGIFIASTNCVLLERYIHQLLLF